MSREQYFQFIHDGRVDELRTLIQLHPELLVERTSPYRSPSLQIRCSGLHLAVHARQLGSATLLLDAGIDVDACTTEGRSALHDSIEMSVWPICELLLERGATVDINIAAILGRQAELAEWLERDPALANDRSTELSPLGWAAFGNQVESAKRLLDSGARMDDGELLCAASVGHTEVGRFLIERGADPNRLDAENGFNALHVAAGMRFARDGVPFVRMLIELGADPSIAARDGRTAKQIAEEKLTEQRARLLQDPESFERPFGQVIELL